MSPFGTTGTGFLMKDGGTMMYAAYGSVLKTYTLTTPYNLSTMVVGDLYTISGNFYYPILIPNGDIVYCLSGGAYKTLTFTGTGLLRKVGLHLHLIYIL